MSSCPERVLWYCFAHRCRTDGTGAALSAFAIAQMKMALRQAPLMSALSDAPDRVSPCFEAAHMCLRSHNLHLDAAETDFIPDALDACQSKLLTIAFGTCQGGW